MKLLFALLFLLGCSTLSVAPARAQNAAPAALPFATGGDVSFLPHYEATGVRYFGPNDE